MNQDFFKHLPSEIMTNILSRLPIQSIAISKCVCKPWLHLLETDEFINSHLAKSIATLAVLTPETDSSSCMIFEFKDEHDLESHDLHYHQLTKFDFPHSVEIYGSADHLLLLSNNLGNRPEQTHYVCNPITREYIELRFPKERIPPYRKVVNYPDTLEESVYAYPPSFTCGFGASKLTGKYKVVLISHDSIIVHKGETPRRIIPKPNCHVYTLGTRSWRRVEAVPPFEYVSIRPSGVFLNGCLHWIVFDSNEKLWISCFDLETECFGTFPAPPLCYEGCGLIGALSILGDCLCFCDHTGEDETVIWLMKEYGVEKSWTKEYVISIFEDLDIEGFELVYPLKVFEDGDILILRGDYDLFYYSMKTRTAREIDIFTAFHPTNSIILTPSFRSLRSFEMENVVKF